MHEDNIACILLFCFRWNLWTKLQIHLQDVVVLRFLQLSFLLIVWWRRRMTCMLTWIYLLSLLPWFSSSSLMLSHNLIVVCYSISNPCTFPPYTLLFVVKSIFCFLFAALDSETSSRSLQVLLVFTQRLLQERKHHRLWHRLERMQVSRERRILLSWIFIRKMSQRIENRKWKSCMMMKRLTYKRWT
jgi:hypothetical protein